jgi:hypothetical protein
MWKKLSSPLGFIPDFLGIRLNTKRFIGATRQMPVQPVYGLPVYSNHTSFIVICVFQRRAAGRNPNLPTVARRLKSKGGSLYGISINRQLLTELGRPGITHGVKYKEDLQLIPIPTCALEGQPGTTALTSLRSEAS